MTRNRKSTKRLHPEVIRVDSTEGYSGGRVELDPRLYDRDKNRNDYKDFKAEINGKKYNVHMQDRGRLEWRELIDYVESSSTKELLEYLAEHSHLSGEIVYDRSISIKEMIQFIEQEIKYRRQLKEDAIQAIRAIFENPVFTGMIQTAIHLIAENFTHGLSEDSIKIVEAIDRDVWMIPSRIEKLMEFELDSKSSPITEILNGIGIYLKD